MSDVLKLFGIDLGTTKSCIAYVDETGRPVIVNNSEGTPITPSVVYFESANNIVVGQVAKDTAVLEPHKTVQFVKRRIGKDKEVYNHEGRAISPEEVSSYILKKVAQDAEKELGSPVKDVVITCPAYFGDAERNSTRQAGILAGFNVMAIINEPTAAALSYGATLGGAEKVLLVLDLGGGTFDVTVLKVGKTIDTICTGGDYNLGGKDWDDTIINYLKDEFSNQTGNNDDITSNLETLQALRGSAEKAKIQLSGKEATNVTVQHDGTRARIDLSREKFNALTATLLQQVISLTDDVINRSKEKGISKFDEIILVGGSCRMPQVFEAVKTKYGMEPKLQDPDAAVAKGAALYAVMKKKGEIDLAPPTPGGGETPLLPGIRYGAGDQLPTITDVTSKTFGVEAVTKQKKPFISNLIMRDTSIPVDVNKTYGTVDANQTSVIIKIYEHSAYEPETDLTKDSEKDVIGQTELTLPPNLPEGAPIKITFKLNENGILEITALDLTGNRSVTATIERKSSLSKKELDDIARRSKGITVT
jgi:molecular chaperone DnaK (HSP70)